MSWKDEMNEAVIRYLVARGIPVDNTPGSSLYYGYIALDSQQVRKHLASCELDIPKCSFTDITWTEFAGTFAESDNDCAGLEATVSCTCGQVKDRRFRYSGGYAEMLKAITE
jgi:hypothetical protein